jgi:hypothetical protein
MAKNKSWPILTGGRAEIFVGDLIGETATEGGVEILEAGIIATVDRGSGAWQPACQDCRLVKGS